MVHHAGMTQPITKSAKFATFALYLSLALIVWFAVAAFGPKIGLIDWKVGLMTMTFTWGLYLIGLAALVAVVALVWTLLKAPRVGWFKALIALAIPLIFVGALGATRSTGESVPPIHDVTTNTANPPMYSAEKLALRQSLDANPITDFVTPLGQTEMYQAEAFAAMANKTKGDLVAEGYPELTTVILPLSTDAAAEMVADAMKDAGFADVQIQGDIVEGVAETFLYGFKDDVVARITATEGGSAVDFRSTSRVGLSDLGENGKRIKALIDALEG